MANKEEECERLLDAAPEYDGYDKITVRQALTAHDMVDDDPKGTLDLLGIPPPRRWWWWSRSARRRYAKRELLTRFSDVPVWVLFEATLRDTTECDESDIIDNQRVAMSMYPGKFVFEQNEEFHYVLQRMRESMGKLLLHRGGSSLDAAPPPCPPPCPPPRGLSQYNGRYVDPCADKEYTLVHVRSNRYHLLHADDSISVVNRLEEPMEYKEQTIPAGDFVRLNDSDNYYGGLWIPAKWRVGEVE